MSLRPDGNVPSRLCHAPVPVASSRLEYVLRVSNPAKTDVRYSKLASIYKGACDEKIKRIKRDAREMEEKLKKELEDVQQVLAKAKKDEYVSAGSYPSWIQQAEYELYGVDNIVRQLESLGRLS